jgi:hypothetical protein
MARRTILLASMTSSAVAAAGLSIADGYTVGQRLYATVWDADETIVGQVAHDLTAEDLSEAAEAHP